MIRRMIRQAFQPDACVAWLSREEIDYAFKDDAAKMIAAKEEAKCWQTVGHHSMYAMTIVDMSSHVKSGRGDAKDASERAKSERMLLLDLKAYESVMP